MIRAVRPLAVRFDETQKMLTLHYRDEVVHIAACARDDCAPHFTRKNIDKVEAGMIFNVTGVQAVSFVNAEARGRLCAGKRPKHLRDCAAVSIVEIRPWLRGKCRSCLGTDRKGSFGHYYTQRSFVAAPLT